MSLSSDQVRTWLDTEPHRLTVAAAASAAGMSRIALSQQLMRGRVQASVIVKIARVYDGDPLDQLSRFREYADLAPSPPDIREVLAFIDWPELLAAVGMKQRGIRFGDLDLGRVTFEGSGRIWVDALDGGSGQLRAQVAEYLGVSASSIAHSLTAGLRPHQAAAFARRAGTPVASALVLTGLLTPSEAGWLRDARSAAIHSLPITDLLEAVGDRTVSALRQERRMRSFEEELG